MSNLARTVRFKDTPIKTFHDDFFRCPRCGFMNRWSRTKTPDRSGVTVYDEVIGSQPNDTVTAAGMMVIPFIRNRVACLPFILSTGQPQDTYYTYRNYVATSGCKHCGQTNLKR